MNAEARPHHGGASAVADNLTVHGAPGLLAHEVTPYEAHHRSAYDYEYEPVVEHHTERHYVAEPEVHHTVDVEHQALPSYEDLLYAYLHHGEHRPAAAEHHDGEIVHHVETQIHEDPVRRYHDYGEHDIDYSHELVEPHLVESHDWPVYQPHHEDYSLGYGAEPRHEVYTEVGPGLE